MDQTLPIRRVEDSIVVCALGYHNRCAGFIAQRFRWLRQQYRFCAGLSALPPA